MSDFNPRYLILHDYGSSPENREGVFNPYHALVFPDGSIRYRDPANPYGSKAPHAYRMNPESIGLSYAGAVGSQPTPKALERLKQEYGAISKQFPGITSMGHGEAYQKTRGTDRQASRDGRDLNEASWRTHLTAAPGAIASAAPPQESYRSMLDGATVNNAGAISSLPPPTPMKERSLISYAERANGEAMQKPMALGGPQQPTGREVIPLSGLGPEQQTAALQSAYDRGNKAMTYIHDSNPRVLAKAGEPSWGPVGDKSRFSGPEFANQFLTKNSYPGAVALNQQVPTPQIAPRPPAGAIAQPEAQPPAPPELKAPQGAISTPDQMVRPAIMDSATGQQDGPNAARQFQETPQLMQQAMQAQQMPAAGASVNPSAPQTPTIAQSGLGQGWRDQPPMSASSPIAPQNMKAMGEMLQSPQWVQGPNPGIKWKNGDFSNVGGW